MWRCRVVVSTAFLWLSANSPTVILAATANSEAPDLTPTAFTSPAVFRQVWATAATASSQYSETWWGAVQATGQPSSSYCGDSYLAWAPASSGDTPEWLEVEFEKPVQAIGILVRENYNSGFIYQLDLKDTDGNYHTVWTGTDTTPCPGSFVFRFEQTPYAVKGARIYTQKDGWEEIDAVALLTEEMADIEAATQQQIEVRWTVDNQGTAAAQPYWYDTIYFSTDSVLDNYDTFLSYFGHWDPLAAGASYTQMQRVTLPGVPAGSYFLILRTDGWSYQPESDETNNDRAVAITLSTPDLTPTALTAPANAATQEQIEVSWTVENQGTGGAVPGWYDTFYLSTDDVLDDHDTQLNYFSWNEVVEPGATYTQTQRVALPGVPAGTYYLILRADGWNYRYESNDANNDLAVAITLTTPDLTPTALTAPSTAATQQQVDITWTVANQGSGAAQPYWYDTFYLSTDAVFDNQDIYVGYSWWADVVDAGASYTRTQRVSLPAVAAGSYYLILRADGWSYLSESNEANNDQAVAITLMTPELTPTALTAPAVAATQQQVDVAWTVTNQGAGAAQPYWYDLVYLSTDTVFDDRDIQVGYFWWSEVVAAGASYTQAQRVSLPAVPAGSYYLILRADAWNYLSESNETNNDRAVAITLTTPDLRPTTLTAPAAAATQEEIDVTWTVANQGAGLASSWWYDRLYLSSDTVWDDQDTQVGWGFGWGGPVGAGASYTQSQRVRLPGVAGRYYLILRVDADGWLYESNEANNDRAVAITLAAPDLTPTALTAPSTAATQQEVEVTWTVANQGGGAAQPYWYDALYLSTDNVPDDHDLQIDYSWNGAVDVGASYTQTRRVQVPAVPAGSYYVILRVDAWNYLYESNEANNTLVIAVTLTAPDLTPTALTAPGAAAIQQQIEVTWTVENRGTGGAQPSWGDGLYLSTDAVWDTQDTALNQYCSWWWCGGFPQWSEAVAAGASYTQTQRVTLPQVPAGTYYLILRADADGHLYESDEANNETQRAIQIRVADAVSTPCRTLDSGLGIWGSLGSVDFSPDGVRLAAAGGTRAFTWDLQTGQLRTRFAGHSAQIDTVDFSPVGDQVLSGARDGTSRIWDAASRQQTRSFSAVPSQPNPATYSADGTKVFAGSGFSLPRLWEAVSGNELRTFPGHTGVVNAVALSPDGSRALTGGSDKTAILWNTETGERLFTFARHTDTIAAVAFSPDGTQALTASDDGSIRLWDVASGTEAAVLTQGSPVVSAAYSHDGKYIVSCGGWGPGTAYLWDASGALIRTFGQTNGDATTMNGIAISPDRTLIATSHSDGQVRLWQSGLQALPLHPITPLGVGSELPVTLRSHSLHYFEVDAAAGQDLVITVHPPSTELALPATRNAALRMRKGPSDGLSDAKFANLDTASRGDGFARAAATGLFNSAIDVTAVRIVASKGRLPSAYEYDYFAQAPLSDLHAEIPIGQMNGGKYYVLVFSPLLSDGSIELAVRADYADFHISSVSPKSAGNAGSITTEIRGTGFTVGTVARLVAPGGAHLAGKTPVLTDSTQMFVTFDLRGAEVGAYDVGIEKPDYAAIGLHDAFQVTAGVGSRLEARLTVPPQVRPGRKYTLYVEYENAGDADMNAPAFYLSNSAGALMQLGNTGRSSDRGLALLGVSTAGLAGTLVPGRVERVPISFIVPGGGAIEFRLSANRGDDRAVDWSMLETLMRPRDVSDAKWSSYWAYATSHLGFTWRDVLGILPPLLGPVSTPSHDASDLVGVLEYALGVAAESWDDSADEELPASTDDRTQRFDSAENVQVWVDRPVNHDNCCTYVITHGWRSSASDFSSLAGKMMDHCPTCNVLRVDWQEGAATPWFDPRAAAREIPAVADEAYRQLDGLLGPGFDWNCVTYIGHSFGNVVNHEIAGHRRNEAGKAPGRAVVLDPASPFGGAPPDFSDYEGSSLSVNTRSGLDAYPCSYDPPRRLADRQLYLDSTSHGGALRCFEEQIDSASPTCDNAWLTGAVSAPESPAGWYDGEMNCDGSSSDTPFRDERCDDTCVPGSRRQGVLRSRPLLDEDCHDIQFTVPGDDEDFEQSAVVRPVDPNDKDGPAGTGVMRLVSAEDTLQYTINFENTAAATAPVQEAVVVDYLDPNLDWTTFRFSDIAYGDRLITVPDGVLEFSMRDFPLPPTITGSTQGQMAVDITASLNTQTGRVEWRLKAIDTATGLPPEDALAGFLPHDSETQRQGHVSFSIKPKADTAAGTRISNTASIVFDTNDPIETNEAWNSIGVPPDVTPTASPTPTPTEAFTQPPTPTLTLTVGPTPTNTPTSNATPGPAPAVDVGKGVGRPGGIACVPATLSARGTQVAGTTNDIGFDFSLFPMTKCSINPDIGPGSPLDKQLTCTSLGAGMLRAVISGNANLIPDGPPYGVTFSIAAGAGLGTYPVTNTPAASDPASNNIPSVTGTPGQIVVTTCTGDCDGYGRVTIGEVIKCVNLFLGQPLCSVASPHLSCPVADANNDGRVSIGEVTQCVNRFLNGC